MPWKEHALEGVLLAGIAIGAGLLAARCQRPLGALAGSIVAVSACAAAASCFRNSAGAACRQLSYLERYCGALI